MLDANVIPEINLCETNPSDRALVKIAVKIYNNLQTSSTFQANLESLADWLKQGYCQFEEAERYYKILLQYGLKHEVSDGVSKAVRLMAIRLRNHSESAANIMDQVRKTIPANTRDLKAWFRAKNNRNPISCEDPRGIIEDLKILCKEFKKVWWHSADMCLSVMTDPITLTDKNDKIHKLGPMVIRLYIHEACRRTNNTGLTGYRIEPNNPNYNSTEDFFHPHICDLELCEGEGKVVITQALLDYRLLDFFTVVDSILKTYNPRDAHFSLESWNAPNCADCGSATNDYAYCCHCEEPVCEDCYICCEDCGDALCQTHSRWCTICNTGFCIDCIKSCKLCDNSICGSEDCSAVCAICEEHVCTRCYTTCNGCGNKICSSCDKIMTKVGHDCCCPACAEEHEDEQEREKEGEEASETPSQVERPENTRPGFTDSTTGWSDFSGSTESQPNRVGGSEEDEDGGELTFREVVLPLVA